MHKPKEILYSKEARDKLITGIDKLANAVKVTLGPQGRHVILERGGFNGPRVTKDGVTVAKHITLKDNFENMGCDLIREAALKTLESVGDGTTTSTLLTQFLCKGSLDLIDKGVNPIRIKEGLKTALELTLNYLENVKRVVESPKETLAIGRIASNGDGKVAALLAEVFKRVGSDGLIHIEQSGKTETEVEYAEGMTFDKGYISAGFVNNPTKMICEMNNPLIFLSENIYTHGLGLAPIFKAYLDIFQNEQRPLVIICNDVQGQALEHMISNKIGNPQQNRPGLPIVAIAAPFGNGKTQKDFLTDLEVLTGATCFRMFEGKTLEKSFKTSHFGTAQKLIISSKTTSIVSSPEMKDSKKLEDHISFLKEGLEEEQDGKEALKLRERLARLQKGIATIRVGGDTEAEMLERKDRVEDAMFAVRAALKEGYVAGGGSTLIRAIYELERPRNVTEANEGYFLFKEALLEPCRQILLNAGKSLEEQEMIMDSIYVSYKDYRDNLYGSKTATSPEVDGAITWNGYDARNNKSCNFLQEGIIDPISVLKSTLTDAVSIASLVLTTEAIVGEAEDGMGQNAPTGFRVRIPM